MRRRTKLRQLRNQPVSDPMMSRTPDHRSYRFDAERTVLAAHGPDAEIACQAFVAAHLVHHELAQCVCLPFYFVNAQRRQPVVAESEA